MGNQLNYILNQYCKFRLKSGKEVFGVIWKVSGPEGEKYVFSSVSDHQTYLKTKDFSQIHLLYVNPDDFIGAEKLVS